MRTSFLLSLLLPAISALADDLVQVGSGKADGNSFDFSLTKAEIVATPRWKTGSEHPAVSPRDAISTARNQLKTFVADGDKWRLDNICLFDLGEDRWIYVVRFGREYPPTTAVFGAEYLEIPVLMDGSTVKPKVVYDERLKMRDVSPK
jgi:hypothetical protein